MNKKTYKQPSLEVIQLDNTDIICTSLTGFRINKDEVGNYENYVHEFDTQDIWGTQW